MKAKTKLKPVFVSGGRGNKYELRGNILLGLAGDWDHFSTRGEWLALLNEVFISKVQDFKFRSYCGRTRADRAVRVNDDGSITIGCNRFSRTNLRKIAKWVEWNKYTTNLYLPKVAKA